MIPLGSDSKGRPRVSPFLLAALLLACGRQDPLPNPTPTPATRIVSLAPNLTEILFALGLDSTVVGVTDFCDYPPLARTRTRVGGMTNPSFETIAELRPDLILMTVAGNSRADHDKLVSLGFTVVTTDPSMVEGVYASIARIGSLTGTQHRADSLITALRQDQEDLMARARRRAPRSVLLLLSLRPIIAAGTASFIDDLLRLANATNAAAGTASAYPLLSREDILQKNPDALILLDDVALDPREIVEAYPEWNTLGAVRNGRVIILNTDLISRPGPRIMEGLRLLISALE